MKRSEPQPVPAWLTPPARADITIIQMNHIHSGDLPRWWINDPVNVTTWINDMDARVKVLFTGRSAFRTLDSNGLKAGVTLDTPWKGGRGRMHVIDDRPRYLHRLWTGDELKTFRDADAPVFDEPAPVFDFLFDNYLPKERRRPVHVFAPFRPQDDTIALAADYGAVVDAGVR